MAFDFQPRLRGSLIELRPLRASDREALQAVASGGAFLARDVATHAVIGASRTTER